MKTLGLLILLFTAVAMAETQPPNIVIIFADDMGYTDVGCFGAKDWKTPHLDRLATHGVRSEKSYCAYPLCCPSRGSLFTSRMPHELGIYGNFDAELSEKGVPTMGELFQAAGYETAYAGKWHVRVPFPAFKSRKIPGFTVLPLAGKDPHTIDLAKEGKGLTVDPNTADAAMEFLAASAIAMVHLSRLAEEMVLWSSAEFGFIELADAFATGSSLMPQKKNPDVPELVRGKTGRAIGNLVALLTVMKGLPLTYNRDMQEDKEPVFDSAATLRNSLEVTTGAIATLRVDSERMARAADDPMLLATDLAEALVRAGVAFREAHEAVGRVVGNCLRKGLDLRSLSRDDLRAFHPDFPASASELLSLERALEARSLPGGPARQNVEAALDRAGEEIRSRLLALDEKGGAQ